MALYLIYFTVKDKEVKHTFVSFEPLSHICNYSTKHVSMVTKNNVYPSCGSLLCIPKSKKLRVNIWNVIIINVIINTKRHYIAQIVKATNVLLS